MRIYTIFDSASKKYAPPYSADTDEVAIRIFKDMFRKMPHIMSDFSLFYVGDFDLSTGLIVARDVIQAISIFELNKEVSNG